MVWFRLRSLTTLGVCAGASALHAYTITTVGASKPMLFLSDLDGTLHGVSAEAQAGLGRWRAFWRQTEAPIGSVLCYNTGRCITDYLTVLQPELPVPDVLITGDGTEIRWCVEGTLELDDEWAQLVNCSWKRVQQRLLARMNVDEEGHIDCLNAVSNSPPHGEARWAITVLGEENALARAEEYRRDFGADVSFYTMSGWGEPKSHLVVAVPAMCGKANAARYVQRKLGFPHAACVAAGDSENDLPMLEFSFIMVANAVDNLVKAFGAASRSDLHYRAASTHANGVVEGLEHFRRQLDRT